jgi:dipeptidyl aminopeptidase/acylaminoacyl peptidase
LIGSDDDISWSRLGRGYVDRVVGDDNGARKKISPAYNADKLRANVLLIHGKKDRRAPIAHFERLKRALEEQGRPPEVLVEPKEGHGFYDGDARERMYTRLIEFLRANTAPTTLSPRRGSSSR